MKMLKGLAAIVAAGTVLLYTYDSKGPLNIDGLVRQKVVGLNTTGRNYIEVLHLIRIGRYGAAEKLLQGYMREQVYEMERYRYQIELSDVVSDETKIEAVGMLKRDSERLRDYVWE